MRCPRTRRPRCRRPRADARTSGRARPARGTRVITCQRRRCRLVAVERIDVGHALAPARRAVVVHGDEHELARVHPAEARLERPDERQPRRRSSSTASRRMRDLVILRDAWTSATSPSRARSAWARPRWPSGSARGSTPRSFSTSATIRSSHDFYSGPRRRRVSGAALLHARAPPPAASAAPGRSLQPDDGLRLPVRARSDLRVPEPRRQRALHLPAAVRSASRAMCRRPTSSSTCRRRPTCCARRIRDRARRADADQPVPGDDYLAELNEAYNHFFFHYTRHAAARRRDLAARSQLGRRGGRRLAEADSAPSPAARGTTCRGHEVSP